MNVLCRLLLCAVATVARAQGPMPEEGATLFPHGAFISYSSIITSNRRVAGEMPLRDGVIHPTFEHEIPLTASWSFRRDFQLTAVLPFVHRQLQMPGGEQSATGVGDASFSLKYRFLRLDSPRGTTQASFSAGPKLPTGKTDASGLAGALLAPELQPGTGSTDWHFNLSGTYTGLFNLHRLVADPSITYRLRSEGDRGWRRGDEMESRLWIHYRPLQTALVGGEWFIGPDLHWRHAAPDRLAGVCQTATGNDIFTAGLTTYISPRGGLVFWASLEFPVWQDWNGSGYEQRRRLNFGFTKQFVIR
ncbi:MAG: hypothetical protein EXQ56_12070 [Acidobacteria bacterium]|nr:hypothetical protein [Acidobacteriota bacterium]